MSALLRVVGCALLVLHLCLVTWFALSPAPTSWAYDANLTPFASVHRAFVAGGLSGLRQLVGGALAVAPLGVLLPLAGGRLRVAWLPSFLQTCAAVTVLATALEFVRTALGGLVLNVDDVLLGVIGAALVHLALVPAGRRALHREHATPAAGAPQADPPAPPTPPTPPAPAEARVVTAQHVAPLPRAVPRSLAPAPRPLSLSKPGR